MKVRAGSGAESKRLKTAFENLQKYITKEAKQRQAVLKKTAWVYLKRRRKRSRKENKKKV